MRTREIRSGINMPKLDGLELRQRVRNDAKLQLKCIPYLFFTTASRQQTVIDAYSASAQGFFFKQTNYNDLKEMIGLIMKYWLKCYSPKSI